MREQVEEGGGEGGWGGGGGEGCMYNRKINNKGKKRSLINL